MRTKIGIVGSGFISRGLTALLKASPDLDVSCVFTRTVPSSRTDFPRAELLTNSLNQVIDTSGQQASASSTAGGVQYSFTAPVRDATTSLSASRV